jgi:ribosomal protein S18 acetylase RimI-like enzyme
MPRITKKRNPVLFQDWGRSKPMDLTSDPTEQREFLPAIEEELDAINKIAQESRFTSGWRSAAPIARLTKEQQVCVVQEDKVITGFLVLCPEKDKPWDHIVTLGVTEARQRKQLGRKLVRWAWMKTEKDELRTMVHVYNTGAIAFFKRLGFTAYNPSPMNTRIGNFKHFKMNRVKAQKKDAQ